MVVVVPGDMRARCKCCRDEQGVECGVPSPQNRLGRRCNGSGERLEQGIVGRTTFGTVMAHLWSVEEGEAVGL